MTWTEKVCSALAHALAELEEYKGKIPISNKKEAPISCIEIITFSDEDLQLGSYLHNRPLYVIEFIRENNIAHILLNCGSMVNIISIFTMKKISITTDELTRRRLLIQGFNQGGQHAIGMIRLKLSIEELTSIELFHDIDYKKSYHISLTVHGCMRPE